MAESLRDKVAIVGAGCCQFGENWDQSPSDMIVDAAYEAYADAGIDDPQRRIDAVFTGSLYSQKGPHECSDALKLWKPVTLVSNYCATGTDAFRCGVFSIAAGVYDTVLVVGYDKPKDRGVSGPSVMMNQVRDLPQTPAGLVRAVRRHLLREVRRRARGAGPDRGQEPQERHAGAEILPQARDHARGGPRRAHDLLAVRALRLRRADRRRRGRDPHARRSREQLPARSGLGARRHRLRRAESAEGPGQRLPLLEADRLRGAGRLPAGGHLRSPARDRRGPGARLLHADGAALLRGPRLLREGLRQGAHRERHLRARGRAAREHRRRPQGLRASDRRHRRPHALRERAPAARPGGAAPGEGRGRRAQPQHRRPSDRLRHRDPRAERGRERRSRSHRAEREADGRSLPEHPLRGRGAASRR